LPMEVAEDSGANKGAAWVLLDEILHCVQND
jgi:hypothetical protein